MPNTQQPLVGIVMGSLSDWEPVMQHTSSTLQRFGIPHENGVFSAHRSAERVREYSRTARERGLKILIAGAGGGAAHLPGMVKGFVPAGFPVIGVPVDERAVNSVCDMPAGAPVMTMAFGKKGALNAAIAAAEILGVHDEQVLLKLVEYYEAQITDVITSHEQLQKL